MASDGQDRRDPVRRADFERFLAALAPLQAILGPVDRAGFDPRLATLEDRWVWWTRHAEAAFDAGGVLTRPVLLHCRGERADFARAAEQAGLRPRFVDGDDGGWSFEVVLAPESRVGGADHPNVEDALAFERELPPPEPLPLEGLELLGRSIDAPPHPDRHAPGHGVARLVWLGDELWVASAHGDAGPPPTPLARLDPATFRHVRVLRGALRFALCGGVARLADGRLLVGWTGATDTSEARISVCAVDRDGVEVEVAASTPARAVAIRTLAVDTSGRWLVMATAAGAQIRAIGPPGTVAAPGPARTAGVVRRRAGAAAPASEPWPVVRDLTVGETDRPGGVVALTPDGAWAARRSVWTPRLQGIARADQGSWSVHGGVGLYDLLAADEATFALVEQQCTEPERPVARGALRMFRASTGAATEERLCAAVGDLRSVAFAPDGAWLATGHFDGNVRLWSRRGARLAEGRVSAHGAVSALAIASDGRIAVGTDRGEVVLLRRASERGPPPQAAG